MARSVLWVGTLITTLVVAGAQPDLRSVLALTLAALAVTLTVATLAAPPPSGRIIAIRAGRKAPVKPRHFDPDAAGRPRPRAPGTV